MRADKKNRSNFPEEWLPTVLLVLIVAVLPFVVFLRIMEFDSIFQQLYGRTRNVNLFTCYRSIWLVIFAGSGLTFLFLNGRIRRSWCHWPLVFYSFLVVLSTVFSKHLKLALWGSPFRCEGMITHLSYMAVVFLFVQFVRKHSQLKVLLAAICVSGVLLTLTGFFQFLGFNYITSDFAKTYLVPDLYSDLVGSLKWSEPVIDQYPAFLTFGNSNFAGSYLAMIFPFSFVLLWWWKGRKRIFLLLLNLLAYVCLLACRSRAGFYASWLGVFLACVLQFKKIRCNPGLFVLLLAAYLSIPFMMDAYTIKGKQRLFDASFNRPAVLPKSIFGNFESLKLGKSEADVVFDGVLLKIGADQNRHIHFFDSSGTEIPFKLMSVEKNDEKREESLVNRGDGLIFSSTDDSADFSYIADYLGRKDALATDMVPIIAEPGVLEIKKEPDQKYLVLFPEKKLRGYVIFVWPALKMFEISRGGGKIYLALKGEGFKMLDPLFRPVELKRPESWGFEGMERFASNRGYIWARTFPLLRRAVLIGYGPDTFPVFFPNYDWIGKLRCWGTTSIIVEKPHNMYLQVFFSSGLLSLIVLLYLFFGYCHESLKICLGNLDGSLSNVLGTGLFVSVTGYLAAGMFNDSTVALAPVFWSFLGLGIAVNRMNFRKSCRFEPIGKIPTRRFR